MFARLVCAVVGHRNIVEREMPRYTRKIKCKRCGKARAAHDGLQVAMPWDDEFKVLCRPGGPLHPGETKPKAGETT